MTDLSKIVTTLQQAGAKTFEAMGQTSQALADAKLEFTQSVMSNPMAQGIDGKLRLVQDLAAMEQTLVKIEQALQNVYTVATEVTGVTLCPVQVQAVAGPAREQLLLAKSSGGVVEVGPKLPTVVQAVWGYIQSELTTTHPKVIKHAEIVQGAQVALGSVGAALKRLSKDGYIVGTTRTGFVKLK